MTSVQVAWQAALAAEHRAFFAYALLGTRLTGTQQTLAIDDYRAHQALRDATENAITAAGLLPVTTEPNYPDLYPVSGAAAARRLAVEVEDTCADAWRYLYAQASADGARLARVPIATLRASAQAGLTASAVRAARWRLIVQPRTPTEPFPGI